MTFRRPKWSESAPRMGDPMNCSRAKTPTRTPYVCELRETSPPLNSFTSAGSTGMIRPKPSTCSTIVTKMKPTAGLRGGDMGRK